MVREGLRADLGAMLKRVRDLIDEEEERDEGRVAVEVGAPDGEGPRGVGVGEEPLHGHGGVYDGRPAFLPFRISRTASKSLGRIRERNSSIRRAASRARRRSTGARRRSSRSSRRRIASRRTSDQLTSRRRSMRRFVTESTLTLTIATEGRNDL